MKVIKWIFSLILYFTGVFLLIYVYVAVVDDLDIILTDMVSFTIFSVFLLVAILLVAPYLVLLKKELKQGSKKSNILLVNGLILSLLIYMFGFGMFYDHGGLLGDSSHAHSLVELFNHVH